MGIVFDYQHIDRALIYDRSEVEIPRSVGDGAAAYRDLLALATRGIRFDGSALSNELRAPPLRLVLLTADLSGVRSLRELSLKYYGDAKYWRFIPWVNPGQFPKEKEVDENTDPATARSSLYMLQILGSPR